MPYSAPGKHLTQRRRYHAAYREKDNARSRTYYAANRQEILDALRLRKYGVSREWVEEMLDAQEGQCAICEGPITTSARVDHDHVTGIARALLCNQCNLKLHALENPDWFASAQSYLEAHRS